MKIWGNFSESMVFTMLDSSWELVSSYLPFKFTVGFKGYPGDFQEGWKVHACWFPLQVIPEVFQTRVWGIFLYHFYLHDRVQDFVQFWKALDFLTESLALAAGLWRGEWGCWLNPLEYGRHPLWAGKSRLKCLNKSTKSLMKNTFKNQSVSM